MTPERWKKIKELFSLAQNVATGERREFLARTCRHDPGLRSEVEKLLDASREDDFLEGDAIAEVASSLDHDRAPAGAISGGPRFDAEIMVNGRYKIVRLLGRGGMGEVYLATDLRIDRNVALKILHPDLVSSPEGLRRFALEAKAISVLNHPHIMTIYESDKMDDGSLFIVAEYVEGTGLHSHIRSGINVEKALDIAIQVASALSAAHEAGITHRDIKPENLVVRRDGYVKVLDFGLAKLTEPAESEDEATASDPEDETRDLNKTRPGAVIGTAAYMSPEQARGLHVDERTDIWSLGVLVYEMLAGRRPFTGDTSADILVSVLVHEPAPLSSIVENLPAELDWIVSKTLSKDVESRYQTAKELRADLEKIRKQIQVNESLGRSGSRHPEPIEVRTTDGVRVRPTSGGAETDIDELQSLGFVGWVSAGARSRSLKLATGIALLAAAAGIAAYLFYSGSARAKQIESIAVLPFANVSGDPELAFLADGLSEALIDKFAQLPQLKVISRNSSFKFREPNADLPSVAGQLGAAAVVTGSVSRQADDLVVRVDVVDAADNRQLAGATYRRKAGDLAGLQTEIAQLAAQQFTDRMTVAESKRLYARTTENSEAFRYYLTGLATLDGSPDRREAALRYFEKAIELDPDFALVYAEMGWQYWAQANEDDDPAKIMPKARAYAERALALDPDLAKARVARAVVYEYEFDWANAEREYRSAIDLSPNLDFARNNYAFFLSNLDRQDEALAQLAEQRLRDPLNQRLSELQKGIVLVQARRFDDALAAYAQAQAVEPATNIPDFALGYAYAGKGLHAEAITYYDKAIIDIGAESEFSQPLLYKAISCANLPGRENEARSILSRIERMNVYVSPALLAALHVSLRENDKAIELLEQAYIRRDLLLRYAGVAYEYDGLRNDRRFKDLLRRANLPN